MGNPMGTVYHRAIKHSKVRLLILIHVMTVMTLFVFYISPESVLSPESGPESSGK